MKPRFVRSSALRNRARRASTLGLFLTLFAVGSAHAQGTAQGTGQAIAQGIAEGSRGSPEQRKAWDAYYEPRNQAFREAKLELVCKKLALRDQIVAAAR